MSSHRTGIDGGAPPTDRWSLAASLVPVLQRDSELRLSDVSWFRTDWQRGGAATGRATWTLDDGDPIPVVLKLPVPRRELVWTRRLQPEDPTVESVVPRLFAGGETVGGYDLAWMVIEAFDHGPLGMRWHADHVTRMADAIARFHLAASVWPVDRPPRIEDWATMLQTARQLVDEGQVREADRWRHLLGTVTGQLPDLVEHWRRRPIDGWIHGDAHLGNAMSRRGMQQGPVALIDLAEIRPGHWLEDAIYFERLLWARPERLACGGGVTPAIVEARRGIGLPVDPDWEELADIRRVLLAATAPCFLKTEGHPKHLAACLDQAEASLTRLGGGAAASAP